MASLRCRAMFRMEPRHLRYAIMTGLCMMSFITFWPVLAADFLTWDDPLNVTGVPQIRALDGENFRWMFFGYGPDIRYKPITYLAWAILYSIDGLRPFIFHLANLGLHSVNACLLFVLLMRLGDVAGGGRTSGAAKDEKWRLVAAGLIALLWAVHPLRVETTAWVSVLSYSLAAFFLQLAMLNFLACDRDRPFTRQRYYWRALILFQFGMMSFPVAIGFSFAFLAVCIFPLKMIKVGTVADFLAPVSRRVVLEILPFFVLTGLMVLVALYGQFVKKGIWGEPPSLAELPILVRLLCAFYYLAYYGWRPFYPFDHYTLNEDLLGMRPTDAHVLFAVLLVVAVSAWVFVKRQSRPGWFAVWVAFVGLLGPVLKLTGDDAFPGPADRYSLIPGLAQAAGLYGLLLLCRQRSQRRGIIAVLAVIAVMFSFQCRKRSQVWKNDMTLYTDQVATLKGVKYRALAHCHLAQLRIEQEDVAGTRHHWDRAWELMPSHMATNYWQDHVQLLFEDGRPGEAIAVLERTLDWLPGDAFVQAALGYACLRSGDRSKGDAVFGRIIENHDTDEPFEWYAVALRDIGDQSAAADVLRRGLLAFPESIRLRDVRDEFRASSPPKNGEAASDRFLDLIDQ